MGNELSCCEVQEDERQFLARRPARQEAFVRQDALAAQGAHSQRPPGDPSGPGARRTAPLAPLPERSADDDEGKEGGGTVQEDNACAAPEQHRPHGQHALPEPPAVTPEHALPEPPTHTPGPPATRSAARSGTASDAGVRARNRPGNTKGSPGAVFSPPQVRGVQ
eukprot:Tamp_24050.p2 GENE.Tamp_24050~~Tamp_24050.p2  ORF type:complete len:173 (-),score=25.18 Tamp_24050:488-982(-)